MSPEARVFERVVCSHEGCDKTAEFAIGETIAGAQLPSRVVCVEHAGHFAEEVGLPFCPTSPTGHPDGCRCR